MTYLSLINNKGIVPLLWSKDLAFNKLIKFFKDTKKVCTVVNIPGMTFRIKVVASTAQLEFKKLNLIKII